MSYRSPRISLRKQTIGKFFKVTASTIAPLTTCYPANTSAWKNYTLTLQFLKYSRKTSDEAFQDLIVLQIDPTRCLGPELHMPIALNSGLDLTIQEFDKTFTITIANLRIAAIRYLKFEENFDETNGVVRYTKQKSTVEEILDVKAMERSIQSKISRGRHKDTEILEIIAREAKTLGKSLDADAINYVSYTERRPKEPHFKECKIKISVKAMIIKVEISLNSDHVPKGLFSSQKRKELFSDFISDNLLQLQSYLSKVNSITESGRFSINSSEIRFTSSFYAPMPDSEFRTCFFLIKKCIDHFYIYTETIYQICTAREAVILTPPLLVAEHSSLPQDEYTRVLLRLNSGKLALEQRLVGYLLEKKKPYLNNKFLLRNIIFDIGNHIAAYLRLASADSFDIAVDEAPGETMDSCFDMVRELAKVGVYFRNRQFLLENFLWNGDKIMYIYTRPLHEVLELLEEKPQGYMDAVVDSISTQLLAKKQEKIGKKFPPLETVEIERFLVNPRAILLEEHIAKERLALYRDNSYNFIERYQGLTEDQGRWALIASAKPRKRLLDSLSSLSPRKFYSYFRDLLGYIAVITSKNSSVAALGPDSLWVTDKGKLKIALLTNDEVEDVYKAPEVRAGRVCRNSLVYSFGKLLALAVFGKNFHRYTDGDIPRIPENFQISYSNLSFVIFESICCKPISRPSVRVLQDIYGKFQEIQPFRN